MMRSSPTSLEWVQHEIDLLLRCTATLQRFGRHVCRVYNRLRRSGDFNLKKKHWYPSNAFLSAEHNHNFKFEVTKRTRMRTQQHYNKRFTAFPFAAASRTREDRLIICDAAPAAYIYYHHHHHHFFAARLQKPFRCIRRPLIACIAHYSQHIRIRALTFHRDTGHTVWTMYELNKYNCVWKCTNPNRIGLAPN